MSHFCSFFFEFLLFNRLFFGFFCAFLWFFFCNRINIMKSSIRLSKIIADRESSSSSDEDRTITTSGNNNNNDNNSNSRILRSTTAKSRKSKIKQLSSNALSKQNEIDFGYLLRERCPNVIYRGSQVILFLLTTQAARQEKQIGLFFHLFEGFFLFY